MYTNRVVISARSAFRAGSYRSFCSSTTRMSSDENKSALDAGKGSVGSHFEADGKIGGTAQQVGGPFDKSGAVGKEFTSEGKVGGTAQAAAEQAQGDKKPLFDKDGAVGSAFKADGSLGSIGQKVGGPFSEDGAVGKQFTEKGAVGGTVQNSLGEKKE